MTHSLEIEQPIQELSTLLDWVRWSVSRFNEAGLYYGHGTDNAWDEAVSLVLQLLHLPQQSNEQMFGAALTTDEKTLIATMVKRRVEERLPIAYLTNQAWFCGYPFYVDERVLVPRSPFAELIELRFGGWITDEPQHILDLCTGSGCIAIALAHAFESAQVDAVDISDDALSVAEINIDEHAMHERVFPIQSDLFNSVKGHKYDLIVSNPPYVDAEDMADLPDEFHHEPELGLAAGDDGLDLVDTILKEAPEVLNPKGWLFVEVGNSQVHMEHKYPGLELEWVEFKHGGHGVFAVQRETLTAYFGE
ncbi:50S ribosomal protein L3 N(5)-glutamine methyltransferase [Aestuariibacter sp. AA17]|uniref:Ribosomal protein uL3 glutamine methyltransferase n=1 Tax=Fluctibacter corallii TaxID=2984329 RepID=A0ABT3A339_9ALTE|nr:50S ribosomal protein L3 N(5)-glutamine methyltransferase [Aestuariibacter sp. AA17]MCV2883098.1 50S ribosomal protein L3 N(5)-glutamine methyltransferase [Aestuariibacter sp. AA17]